MRANSKDVQNDRKTREQMQKSDRETKGKWKSMIEKHRTNGKE